MSYEICLQEHVEWELHLNHGRVKYGEKTNMTNAKTIISVAPSI